MPDDALRGMLAAALERLRAEQLAKVDAAELPPESPLRVAIHSAINRLQDRLAHDPAWVDEALKEILTAHQRRTK